MSAADTQRIAFFLQDLRGGGAERNVVRRVNRLAALGLAVDLVLVNRRGEYLDLVDPRVRIVDLGCSRTLAAIPRLKAYLERDRPAAVSAHMTHTNVAAILARGLSRHRPRLVVVEHNQYDRNLGLKRGLVRAAYRSAGVLYRFADGIGAVAEGVATTLCRELGLAPERVRVIYNPVVGDDIAGRAAAPVDHRFFPKTAPVLVAAGRLAPQKNFDLLFRALALMRVPARLIVLGEGELRGRLERLRDDLGLADRIDMPGFLADPFPVMAAADVFVLSSDWEGLPTVLIEALACGTPVVATDCESGPAEILENGRHGRLVACGDPEALARAIEETLADPGDRAARLARARTYSLDNAVRLHLDLMGIPMPAPGAAAA